MSNYWYCLYKCVVVFCCCLFFASFSFAIWFSRHRFMCSKCLNNIVHACVTSNKCLFSFSTILGKKVRILYFVTPKRYIRSKSELWTVGNIETIPCAQIQIRFQCWFQQYSLCAHTFRSIQNSLYNYIDNWLSYTFKIQRQRTSPIYKYVWSAIVCDRLHEKRSTDCLFGSVGWYTKWNI